MLTTALKQTIIKIIKEKGVILMEQILESAYLKDMEKWNRIAKQNGGLEICGEDGYPIYTIGGND